MRNKTNGTGTSWNENPCFRRHGFSNCNPHMPAWANTIKKAEVDGLEANLVGLNPKDENPGFNF